MSNITPKILIVTLLVFVFDATANQTASDKKIGPIIDTFISSIKVGVPRGPANPVGSAECPDSSDGRVLFIGHKLSSKILQEMVRSVAVSMGKTAHSHEQQTIAGATLNWNWNHPGESPNSRDILPTGVHDVLIMTQAVPLAGQIRTWEGVPMCLTYANNFHKSFLEGDPQGQAFIYETWHCVYSGTGIECPDADEASGQDILWRARIDNDQSEWESIAEQSNQDILTGAKPMNFIPEGQAIGKLSDEIEAGNGPRRASIVKNCNFDIHLNDEGWYFISLAIYANIQGENLLGAWYGIDDAKKAAVLQQFAWDEVSNYYGWVDG